MEIFLWNYGNCYKLCECIEANNIQIISYKEVKVYLDIEPQIK